MRKTLLPAFIALSFGTSAIAASAVQVSGQGRLENGRTFSISAQIDESGTASGRATLVNTAFTGANGKSPYRATVDISCAKPVGDNSVILGGLVRNTNDPNLTGAVFFIVQDNGEPGAGKDRVSRAFFWDDDPATVGDPQACLNTNLTDFPLEPIQSGNIQVRTGG